MSDTLLTLKEITKTYTQGGKALNVLNAVNLQIEPGEIVALVGPSGSGKSTLLQIAGLLDRPTSGLIAIAGQDVSKASDNARTKLRRETLGFIYQFHYLQGEFSAKENVIIPQMIAGRSRKRAAERATLLLSDLGLLKRLDHRPAQLSGGEQQRVAIARAMANFPKLILADEPTGNLDPETSDFVFNQLLEQVRTRKIGALVATHNMDLADRMDRILELKHGRVSAY